MKWILALLLILVALTLWMFLRANRNEAAAEAKSPPLGTFVEVMGTRVHLTVEGSGPPIVLIHGASGNLRDMTFKLSGRLADRFTVISVDRPGLGYTPPIGHKGATLSEQSALLAAAVRKLGYDRIYLLGQSFGGSVALDWTIEQPDMVAGLVLVAAPSNVWSTPLGTTYKLNVNPLSGPVFRLLVSAFPPNSVVAQSLAEIFAPQPITKGYADYVGTGLTLRRATQRANGLQVAALKAQIRELVPHYGEIAIPVEAIHGTGDTIVPYEIHTKILAGQIKGINVTVLDGVGHMPHHTNIKEVIAAIDRVHQRVGLTAPQP